MQNILKETNFKHLGTKKVGKVRDVYVQEDRIILVATDRYSAFDRNLALIPHKGAVLTQATKFWFDKTKHIVPNHVIAYPDPNVVVAQKCEVLPIEMIIRGYITGVTNTALWTLYQEGERDFGNFKLPEGMKKNQKLPKPVITPTTKFEAHDRPLTPAQIIKEGMVSKKNWDKLEKIAIKLFLFGQKLAAKRGLTLVDTKYEFGLDKKGKIILIDEIHTPDSSRWWKLKTYVARMKAGAEPEYFDKEFLRIWFKDHFDPYKDKKAPKAPPAMVTELSRRYIQIYQQLTGKKFKPGATPIAKRIERNLRKYEI